MAQFTNQATLSYTGGSTTSNVTVGELVEVLTATKNSVTPSYGPGDTVTYAINLVNSGLTSLNGLTITDNLGSYDQDGNARFPLTYVPGSVQFYVNGAIQATPTVTPGTDTLVFSGINIPASSNALILYEASVNEFAPQDTGDTITNTATVNGAGLSAPLTASDTINVAENARLSISKAISPATVAENGEITYTFVIQNSGNTEADAADALSITDTFDPILDITSVTYNGTPWTSPANYTYNEATGLFTSVPGQITVPAATYTQDPTTGVFTVNPGVRVLTITGII